MAEQNPFALLILLEFLEIFIYMGRNIIIEIYIPLYISLYDAGFSASALFWASVRIFDP